ncbi:MAG TPA: alpha/beta fold hydrolase [Vicinamibacteria bacterium]|nr:alpha/beta fold hydrolase [Vicinamibacteria bacterium]
MAGLLRTIRRAALQVQRLASALEVPGAENRVEKRTDFSNCPRPVLLLHGWFSARRTFEVLERRLRRDGYGVFSLDLGGARVSFLGRGVDDLADLVRAKVERIYARHPGLGPLTIVGHSKGGLIAAYYVKKLGGWRRTRAVVTLGTPHRGTPTAWFGLPFALVARSLVQMIPGSPFLARLHDGPWPAQVRLVSIWSRQDGASPYPSCVIDTHGLPQLANVEVEGDHRAHLVRKRTYEVILREVRAAEADAPVQKGPLTGMAGGRSKIARAAVAARTAGTDAA